MNRVDDESPPAETVVIGQRNSHAFPLIFVWVKIRFGQTILLGANDHFLLFSDHRVNCGGLLGALVSAESNVTKCKYPVHKLKQVVV